MYLYVKESEYMKPTIKNYVFLHVAFLIYSIILVYMKWASKFPVTSISFFIAYFGLIVLLFGYAILWQQVIKNFEISKAYSHRGIIILWSMLWSVFLFGDTIQWNNLLGAAIIIVGIVVVTKDE
jgi:drug/metabolite transporter (DMT)-like permease